jgi:hypothetical protein
MITPIMSAPARTAAAASPAVRMPHSLVWTAWACGTTCRAWGNKTRYSKLFKAAMAAKLKRPAFTYLPSRHYIDRNETRRDGREIVYLRSCAKQAADEIAGVWGAHQRLSH